MFFLYPSFCSQGLPSRGSPRTVRERLVRWWYGRETGLSVIELLVAIALIGVMGALAIPRLNQSVLNLSSATQNLVGNIRMTRANAVSRGAHYRITLGATSYSIERLHLDADGNWVPDPGYPSEDWDLPSGISLNVTSGDGIIEFDTRGLIVPPPDEDASEIEEVTIHDSQDGDNKHLEIWPSGQVLEG
jgi:type II secretory pathway pseudopilin PulG